MWYQHLLLCTRNTASAHSTESCSNFCFAHFCQLLLSLFCNYLGNSHWKTGHHSRNLNNFFKLEWPLPRRSQKEAQALKYTPRAPVLRQYSIKWEVKISLIQQTESSSNTAKHQPLPGQSALETCSIFAKALLRYTSTRTVSRTALKIVCAFPESLRQLLGWRSLEENKYFTEQTLHINIAPTQMHHEYNCILTSITSTLQKHHL